jgi:hypothetical protein
MKKQMPFKPFMFFKGTMAKLLFSGPLKYTRIFLVPVLLILIVVAGCSYFKVSTTYMATADDIASVLKPDKKFVFHHRNNVFVGDQLYVQNDSLIGIFSSNYTPYIKPGKKHVVIVPEPDGSAYRYKRDSLGRGIVKEIHLFSDTIVRKKDAGQVRIALNLRDINRFDVYSKDGTTNTLSFLALVVLSVPVFFAAFFGVLLLLSLITGSCPFIYVNTGDGFQFEGEIYSGAVYAPLERHDYLILPHLVAENGEYLLKMSNEVQEIQYTNLMELLVVDHPAATKILIDKYGNCQTSVKPESPYKAVNLAGSDLLDKVKGRDSLVYAGELKSDSIPLVDGVIMTFARPPEARSGKLFLHVKNSQWLDYVYKNTHDLLGSYYDNWVRKQNKADPQKLKEWPLSQKIPLSVYIEKNGRWEFCDYLNMAGPMAFRDDVISLDLAGVHGDSLKIKLEAGAFFWEIDYAAIDYSLNLPVKITQVKPNQAITGIEKDITDLLQFDDMKYFVQSANADLADISYKVPPAGDGERTVILHSKGYYQMLSEGEGRPEIRKLKEIRESGQFLEYSRELMEQIINGEAGSGKNRNN